ncbi:similar to An17g01080 [Aspergillus luchuensis]|uniref:Similar to An17g01080 n=1 Tax=Aspergillus kawachii TaxID=1069201 RepID=A0A146G0B3_ASPKA|nr:similar to An17g01080 [Aspergillus luchuensis]
MALVPLQSFSILICPVIILLALNFPGIFYRNAFTQYATVLAVVLTSWEVLLSVTFENPVFAYLVGLFEAWMGIWAFVLVVFIIRARNFVGLYPFEKRPTAPQKARPHPGRLTSYGRGSHLTCLGSVWLGLSICSSISGE